MPDYKKAARRAARKYGINEGIFLAMIQQESGFRPGVSSPAGAQGIAQFIPSTADAYGVNLRDGRVTDDLEGAARYLRDNLKRTGGNYTRALSIYNSGRPDGYLSIPETKNYVKVIRGNAGKYSRSGSSGGSGGGYGGNGPVREDSYRTVTTPGVDRSADRQAAKVAYLAERGKPGALIGLKQQLDSLADTPSVSRRVRVEGDSSSGRSRGVRGASTGSYGGTLNELFYNGPGGVNVDENKRVPKGFVSGHTDHVHVAAGVKSIQSIAKLAQRMGLTVRELAPYDKVDPVHTGGSFHYRGRAADVSGDPKKMAAFSRRVAKMYGVVL